MTSSWQQQAAQVEQVTTGSTGTWKTGIGFMGGSVKQRLMEKALI
jgi:hypothetical protein